VIGRGSARRGLGSRDENDWQAEFDERIAALERKITSKIEKGRRSDLDTLTRAGVERRALLRLLAFVVDEEGNKSWTDPMRATQESLKSIAGRISKVADDAEKRARDPLSVVQAWFFFFAHGAALGAQWPKPLADDPAVPFLISGMRALAERWREQAGRFGHFLKRYGDRRTNTFVPIFLCFVCVWLRKPNPDHWYELANILADAFEAAGVKKRFSADWLQKVWKRRGKPLLRVWLKLKIDTPRYDRSLLSPISLPSRRIRD
jgi:hypothetical protein